MLLVGDSKDITLGDAVELIDDSDQQSIGQATVNQVTIRNLSAFADSDQALVNLADEHIRDSQVAAKKIDFTFTAHRKKAALAKDDVEKATNITSVKLYGDGGSRGNPGPSASGWVIYDQDGNSLKSGGLYLGITTNNQAEYTALKQGLLDAQALGAQQVSVFMDSLLVINQMKGIWKVKNADLWPLHSAIKQLASQFQKVTYQHVPRELNKAADSMVNQTLDNEARR